MFRTPVSQRAAAGGADCEDAAVAWGDRRYGGDISAVKAQLDHGIEHVWSTRSASLVQLKSGEVVVWGDRSNGDEMAAVKAHLDQGIEHVWSTGINFLVQLRVLFSAAPFVPYVG